MRLLLFFIGLSVMCSAQPTFPYNGVLPKDVSVYAITHATLYQNANTRIDNATLVFAKGRIVAVGAGLTPPKGAVVIDASQRYVYPSFIESFCNYGIETPAKLLDAPQGLTSKSALGWNDAVHPEFNAASSFRCQEEKAKELRALGFGAVITHRTDGIFRGTGALVSLGNNPNLCLLKTTATQALSFNKGSSITNYPNSLMGCIALLRQTFYDAQWYAAGGNKWERNLSLEAIHSAAALPVIFDAAGKRNLLRAAKIFNEFKLSGAIRGNGNEYQFLDDIAASKCNVIVPLNFPDAWDVSDPFVSRMVSLDEMKHWELAPFNCAMMQDKKIPFAITTADLTDKSVFLKNLRKAVKCGLSEGSALEALTTAPAKMLQIENEVGSLDVGKWANFFIASANIFRDEAVLLENWVQGEQYVLDSPPPAALAGTYQLQLPNHTYNLKVVIAEGKLKGSILLPSTRKNADGSDSPDTIKYVVNLQRVNQLLTLHFTAKDSFYSGVIRLSGNTDAALTHWSGTAEMPDGTLAKWSAQQTENKIPDNIAAKNEPLTHGNIIYPFTAYGSESLPMPETLLIKNATLWTCEKEGKIEGGEILIAGGKIIAAGKKVDASAYKNITVLDAAGKHVTPGIIDEHSHIALESVNESGQASSAEVTESSVMMPDDINIYRQLSGGVTGAQLLHGSANPIGGQSALVKLHWTGNADKMLIQNTPGFIKFALGENVKQSNWYSDGTRFPQTRMGVEQFYYDHFIRAREYAAAKKNATAIPFRKDLELEALQEILEKKRFVTCHSYVQSEINMLMHVADSMRFTLNTFTHILEGYKVADKMKQHGAGASSFSDWWAYKFEVKDAIPHNGALMWREGITVAFNSDDAEMARRLNQEAAKAVKYGGVPEEEALKFVTINPAKLLHIDNRTGSLKAGKDADIVIWSDHPLSIYAKAEQTFVEGIRYFDKDRDEQLRNEMKTERARLIQKMLNAKNNGEAVQSPTMKDKRHFHCDTIDQTAAGIDFR